MATDAHNLAANLRRYRQTHGLSQAALAEKAGLSRIGYRDIELGKSEPFASSLVSIARALGLRVQDLLAPVRILSHVRFRSDKRMSLRENILADTARRLEAYGELEQILGEQNPWNLAPLAAGLTDGRYLGWPAHAKAQAEHERYQSSAEHAAQATRRFLGLDRSDHQEIVYDVCGLLEGRGVMILTTSVKSEGFLGLSVSPNDDIGPAILINVWDRISVECRIFTVIRELGHLLMHPGAYDVGQTNEDRLEERQADTFASHFLMPQGLFKKEWIKLRGLDLVDRVLRIKRIFRVGWKTVLHRVIAPLKPDTRLAVWAKFTAACEQRSGRGPAAEVNSLSSLTGRPATRAAHESARLDPNDFQVSRFARLVRQAVELQAISVARAAELLGLSVKDMRSLARSWIA